MISRDDRDRDVKVEKSRSASGPLRGIRVLEMAGIGPGPVACMLLSDLGADVLRVDRPAGTLSPVAHRGNEMTDVSLRGRPVLRLDVKTAEGRDKVRSLAASADVLVEGFRPGVMERLGLGPDVLLAANPALVYGRMTGWGQDGPLAASAGHDIGYIALTGALHAIGPAEGPPVPPLNLLGDFGGGSLFLALGVVCALLEARASAKGQVVDANVLDGTHSLMAMIHGRMAAGVWQDKRQSNMLDGGAPWYATYETSDGRYVAIGALEPQFYEELCRRIGWDDAPDAQARLDRARWPSMRATLQEIFRSRTRDEWSELMEYTDACFAPVLSISEAAAHPHTVARGSLVDIEGLVQPAPAPRFSRTPGAIQSQPGRPEESGESRASRWLGS